MNPFSTLVAQVTPRPPRPCTEDIVVTYTVTRTYRPTGRTLEMIRALRERGPMTSAQLADAVGVPSKQVLSLLARPLEAGLVLKHTSGDTINWSAA